MLAASYLYKPKGRRNAAFPKCMKLAEPNL